MAWQCTSPGGASVVFGLESSNGLADHIKTLLPAPRYTHRSAAVISSSSARASAEARRVCQSLEGVFSTVHYLPDAVEHVQESGCL